MYLLGIKIDEINRVQALAKVREFLCSKNQHTIFTPNPEILVKSQKDQYFKQVLNTGDLNLCDGMGVQICSGIKRIPGVDFMLEVCKLAAEQEQGVYLLGSGNDEVVRKACENLHVQFPNLPISGYNKGPESFDSPPTRSEKVNGISTNRAPALLNAALSSMMNA
jgi:N-acetylglucosaminyldiphosphoundecaprenol N-acetyl-beta-D-mannosaminyltransferase